MGNGDGWTLSFSPSLPQGHVFLCQLAPNPVHRCPCIQMVLCVTVTVPSWGTPRSPLGTQTVTLSFAVSDSGTAKWETSLNGHYRARGASVVHSEPFNWQKSLALEKNVNEVVGMWLCLRMWLFYLNFLTSFNPAIRVWGFSSGFPHSRVLRGH